MCSSDPDYEGWAVTLDTGLELGEPEGVPFDGVVTVSSVIIDQLSSGLYDSPAACLKELVNNSYDADATEVFVTVRPDAALLVIDDNGTGLNKAEFENHFRRIARSYKREDGDKTSSGRPKIGKIGIGFIAANEICERLEILSTKVGSTDLLHVTLDFQQMRLDADQRRNKDESVSKADYYGAVTTTAKKDEHYTRIFLTEVKEESMRVLDGTRVGKPDSTIYGATLQGVKEILERPSLRTWGDLDLYSKTVLEIGLNVPVRYHEGWAGAHSEALGSFTSAMEKWNFSVHVDGTELRRPVLFPESAGRSIVRKFAIAGDHVSATGYLFALDHKLTPIDLNGVNIRIRNAGVGGYDRSYLDYPGYKSPIFQDWVSAELIADDRLEEALNIDRKTLRTTHPSYVELQSQFHDQLDSFFSEVRRELYGTRSAERKREVAQTQARRIAEASGRSAPSDLVSFNLPDGESVEITIDAPFDLSKRDIDSLSRTYRPTEILQVVKEAASDAGLPTAMTEALLAALGRKFF